MSETAEQPCATRKAENGVADPRHGELKTCKVAMHECQICKLTASVQQRQKYHGGSILSSPRNTREAEAREAVRELDKIKGNLQKARAKKQREEA
jgi:hypothetical protein